MDRQLVSFRLADDLRLALKERASTEGISTTELVNRLLRKGLSENEVDHKVNLSTQARLLALEEAVLQLNRRLDYQSTISSQAVTQPQWEIEKMLTEMEGRLEQRILAQISEGVEESRQNLRRLVRAVADTQGQDATALTKDERWVNDYSQETHQGHQFHNTVAVSLEDLRKLLKSDD